MLGGERSFEISIKSKALTLQFIALLDDNPQLGGLNIEKKRASRAFCVNFAEICISYVFDSGPMNYLYRYIIALAAALSLAPIALLGQSNIFMSCENTRNTYIQSFGGLAPNTPACGTPGNVNWTNAVTIEGWYVARNGVISQVTPFNATDGTCNLTGFYNMAPTGPGARTLGTINHAGQNVILLRLINDSNTDLTSLDVGVFYAQWRRGNSGANPDNLQFQWGRNISIIDPLDPTPPATWTTVPALQFNSPVTGPVGPVNPASVNFQNTVINLPAFAPIAPGDDIWLRWNDLDLASGDGQDDGLGISQVLVTANFRYPAAPTVSGPTFQACNSPGSTLNFNVGNLLPFNPVLGNTEFRWNLITPGPVFVGPSAGMEVRNVTVDYSSLPPGNYDIEVEIEFHGNSTEPGSCYISPPGSIRRTITVVPCGPITLTCLEPTYSQAFDNVTNMPTVNSPSCGAPGNMPVGTLWFNDQTVPGWTGQYFGIAGITHNSDDGSACTNASLFWYGNAGSGERAFGTRPVGADFYRIGARFRNSTGNPINNFTILYTGEQWRRARTDGNPSTLRFQYSTDATTWTNGTWTDVPALNFASPNLIGAAGARDGNLPANRSTIGPVVVDVTPLLPGGIPNGSQFWIRWELLDNNDGVRDLVGPEDGLSIDDFFIIIEDIQNQPPTVINGPSQLCPGEQGTYTAAPNDPCVIYAWENNLPAGATYVGAVDEPTVVIDWGTAAPGTYPVTVNYSLAPPNFQQLTLNVTIGNCGPIVVDCANLTYDQDFDGIAPAINSCANPGNINWTNNLSIPGWYLTATNLPNGYPFNASDGSCALDGFYFFGLDADGDRAMGSINSNDDPMSYAVRFVNQTGSTINAVTVSYQAEQWRRGGGSNIDDFIGLGGVQVGGSFPFDPAGTLFACTFAPACEFFSPNTSAIPTNLNGNVVNQLMGPNNINIPGGIANGQEFWVIWNDAGLVGFEDDGLAIDDVTITFDAAPPQPTNITGTTTPCLNTTEVYTAIPNVAGVTYTWGALPAGATYVGGNTGNPKTIDWGTAVDGAYTLEVVASNACGNSQPTTLNVNLGPCGPLTLSCANPNYAQGFDGLTPYTNACSPAPNNINWVDDQSIRGWYRELVSGNDRFYANDGSCANGATFGFGLENDPDRALGMVQSGTHVSFFGVNFQNGDAAATITDLIVRYVGEQWRRGGAPDGTPDRLIFEYSTDATSLTTGTWNAFPALDFLSPVTVNPNTQLNGNLPANRQQLDQVITGLNIAPGQDFWLRWTDFNVTNADDALAVDELEVIINTVPMPTALSHTAGALCEGTQVTLEATPAAPANVSYDWFDNNFDFLGSGSAITHTFNTPGTYTITVSPQNLVTGCVSNLPSPELIVDVSPITIAGTLNASQTVCYGDQVVVQVTGRQGNVLSWYESNDNFVTETPILFTGDLLLPAPIITENTWYEVEVQSGNCPAQRTNRVLIDLSNNPGTISSSGPTNACFGQGSGTLTLSGFVGNVVRWEATTGDIDFTNPALTTVLNNVTATQAYNNLERTTYFRAVVQGPGCPLAFSPGFAINVLNFPGSIVADLPTTVCSGDATVQLTLTNFTGNVVRWETSTDNFVANIVTVANATAVLPVANITQNQCYRAVISAPTCPELTQTPVCFTVQPCTPVTFTCDFTEYTQDFASLTPTANDCSIPGNLTWINNSTVQSWYVQRVSGTENRFNANDGTCDQGGIYSYGLNGDGNRALGTLRSGTAGYIIGARFRNNTGSTITQINVAYIGEQWRRGNAGPTPDRWAFSYSTDPATTSLTSGVWTAAPGGDMFSPVTAGGPINLNGNLLPNRTLVNTPPLAVAIPNGQDFWIRWEDIDLPGGNDGFGIDDILVRVIFNTNINFVPTIRNVTCNGGSDGSFDIRPLNPASNYSYQWSANVPAAQQNSASVTGLTAGNYTVTITDDDTGCERVYSDVVFEPAQPLAVSLGAISQPGCSAPTGSINLNVSGGTPNYTFQWSNGATAQNLTNLTPDIYAVTVTDANGCQQTIGNINLFLASPIIIDAPTITNVTCFGSANGTISLVVTGGTPPLTYSWSNGANTQNVSNLAGGAYTVTVTDGQGCSIVRTYNVLEPGLLFVQVNSVKNVTCNGGNDGAIGVDIEGGTAPLTIIWSNAATQENLSGLSAGAYTVSVTDVRGCFTSRLITVGQPNVLQAQIVSLVQPTCNGSSNGRATVQVSGGTPTYTFLWNNGETTQTATALRGGPISVDVFDAAGCRVSANATLNQPTALNLQFTNVSQIRCNGQNNGSISSQVSGGTPPYNFVWSNAATSGDLNNLGAGVYTLTVTDQRGCTAVRTAQITEPNALSVSVAGLRHPGCFGDQNGEVSFQVTGGVFPYVYTWTSNSTNVSAVTGPSASNLAAGSYTLTVRDANNCTASGTGVLNQPGGPLTINLNFITNVTCSGASDGQIATTITGGTQPYSITWTNSSSTQDGLVNVSAGSYTIRVVDASGCTTQQTYTVTQPQPLSVALVSAQNVSCPGGSDGAITVSATGGNGSYVYAWAPGSGAGPSRTNLTAGNYFVTVRDARNCTATLQHTLTQPQPLQIVSLSLNQRNPSCNGGSDGSIDVTVMGGTPGYTYEWRRGATIISFVEDLTNVAAGSYTLTVRDSRNCSAQQVYALTQPTALTAAVSEVVNPLCFGQNTGSALVTPSGGTSPYTYRWSNGWTGSRLTFALAGNYTVTVTDARNCTFVTSATINQPNPVSVNVLSVTPVVCRGASSGAFIIEAVGGTPSYTYRWSNGANTSAVNGLAATTYSVTATDANGCRAIRSDLTITQPATAITINQQFVTDAQCGGLNTGAIAVDVSGGTPGYIFQWNDGPTTEDRGNLAPGTYILTVLDANGCSASRSFTVGGPTLPLAINTDFVNNVTCSGQLNGSISVTPSGGTMPYAFRWSNGSTDQFVNNLRGGAYAVTLTDANGCLAQQSYTITEPQPVIIELMSLQHVRCRNGSTGTISVQASGGTGPYSYTWTNGAVGADVTNLKAGIYNVIVRDANNCVAVASYTISETNVLTVHLAAVQNVRCFGETNGRVSVAATGGVPPYSYIWNGPPGNNTINNIPAGTYIVLVTDQAGCTATLTQEVTQPAELQVSTGSKVQARCNGASNGALGINVSGGVLPYTYAWSNGATTEDLNQIPTGNYSVTVTDANGCTASHSDFISEPDPLAIVPMQITPPTCHDRTNGLIAVTASGGTPDYRYNWSGSFVTQPVRVNLAGGTYTVTVTDQRGCKASQTFTLQPPAPLVIDLVELRNTTCSGRDRGLIDIQPQGGTAPYTYWWSTSSNVQDLVNIPEGTYVVNVVDSKGCSVFRTFEVQTQPTVSGVINGLASTYCTNSAPAVMTSQPAMGTFSGPGVTGNTFNPATAGPGTHTITVNGTFDDCPFTGSMTVTVNASPANTGTFSFVGSPAGPPFCTSSTTQYLLSFSPGQANVTVAYSGKGVLPTTNGFFRFSPALAGGGTHVITATLTNTLTGCTSQVTRSVLVDGPENVTVVSDKSVVCNGESAVLQASGGDTYTWSPSTGLSCAPNCTNVGASVTATPTLTRTYTVTARKGGCTRTATVRVEVKNTTPIFVTPSSTSICQNTSSTLTAFSNTPFTYTWSPAESLSNATGSNVLASPQNTTTYTVTGSFDGCTATQTVRVTVNPSLVNAVAAPSTICQGQSASLQATTTEPGNFTFAWSPSTGLSSASGAIVTASPSQTTTYTVVRSGTSGCRTATVRVEVKPVSASINNLASNYCETSPAVLLSTTPAGGVFIGPGVTGNLFDPAVAGPGVHVIESIFDNINGCPFRVTQIVTVGNSSSAVLTNLAQAYCAIASPVTLTGQPVGGTFSGPGVFNGNEFRPQTLTPNQVYKITYSGVNPEGGCTYARTFDVEVRQPVVSISGLPSEVCAGSSPIQLTGAPSGGTFSGKGVVNGNLFDAAAAGAGVHLITYFGNDGVCSYSTTVPVRVLAGPTASAVASNASCATCNNGSLTISAVGGSAPYQFSIDGGLTFVGNSQFANLLPGNYSIRVRDSKGCVASTSATITGSGGPSQCLTPTIVSVEPGVTTATVNYGLVSGATSYVISWRRNVVGSPWITVTINSTTATQYLINNLVPGAGYQLRIRARCGSDQSAWSNAILFDTQSGRESAALSETIEGLSVYPNPNRGDFALSIQLTAASEMQLLILDAAGRLVERRSVSLQAGASELPIKLDVSAGVYLLRIEINNEVHYQKVLIQ